MVPVTGRTIDYGIVHVRGQFIEAGMGRRSTCSCLTSSLENPSAQIESIRIVINQLRDTTVLVSDAHARALEADPASGSGAALSEQVTALSRRASELASEVRERIVQLNDRHKKGDREGFEARRMQLETTQRAFKSALENVFRVEKEARNKTRERLEKQYRLGEFVKVDLDIGSR